MVHFLIYVSDSTFNFDSDESALYDIFEEACTKNLKKNISGFLTFKNGNFLQLLEGDEVVVNKLFSKIKKDSRHNNVILISEGTTEQRLFNDYASGFLTPLEQEVYSKFVDYLNFLKLLENNKVNNTVSTLEIILSKM